MNALSFGWRFGNTVRRLPIGEEQLRVHPSVASTFYVRAMHCSGHLDSASAQNRPTPLCVRGLPSNRRTQATRSRHHEQVQYLALEMNGGLSACSGVTVEEGMQVRCAHREGESPVGPLAEPYSFHTPLLNVSHSFQH